VDTIVRNGRVFVVEVNPRYTASVEILERACGMSFFAWHVAACLRGERPVVAVPASHRIHGKAIVYATESHTIDGAAVESFCAHNADSETSIFADIPQPGTSVARGDPILTVFGESDALEGALEILMSRADYVRNVLAGRS
jgi:predicted ATP-grasp superfamily ATP-dependent carboligase